VSSDTEAFDQPVAMLMAALLHYVPDADDPAGIPAIERAGGRHRRRRRDARCQCVDDKVIIPLRSARISQA